MKLLFLVLIINLGVAFSSNLDTINIVGDSIKFTTNTYEFSELPKNLNISNEEIVLICHEELKYDELMSIIPEFTRNGVATIHLSLNDHQFTLNFKKRNKAGEYDVALAYPKNVIYDINQERIFQIKDLDINQPTFSSNLSDLNKKTPGLSEQFLIRVSKRYKRIKDKVEEKKSDTLVIILENLTVSDLFSIQQIFDGSYKYFVLGELRS